MLDRLRAEYALVTIPARYANSMLAIERRLRHIGRMSLVEPPYKALTAMPQGQATAERIHAEARAAVEQALSVPAT